MFKCRFLRLQCGGRKCVALNHPEPLALENVVIALLCSAIAGIGLFLWRRKLEREYALQLESGSWHQGIIVFPSGDIVVRFHQMLGTLDKTIEAAFLSRAEVEKSCAPWRPYAPIQTYLRLYYIGIDGRPCAMSVCQTDLRDSVAQIADYISELKSKAMVF